MVRPAYSVLISSRNEGDYLRRTVEGVLSNSPASTEIVIVDDASNDGSTDFLRSPQYSKHAIRLHRNPEKAGLIASRATAAELAAGKYLCVLDAHCRVESGWLDRLAEGLHSIDDRGIIVPVIYKLDPDRWTLMGKIPWFSGCTLKGPCLGFVWTEPTVLDGRTVTCTIAGGAWMCCIDWYRHIGGLDRDMLTWGGENIDLPLRTWLAGGTCLVQEQVHVGHVFGPKETTATQQETFSKELLYNKVRLAHTLFSKDVFHRILRNLQSFPGFDEAMARLRQAPESAGYAKGQFESVRQRDDAWLLETFELPILEPPYFHRPVRHERIHKKRRPHPKVTVVVSSQGDRNRLDRLARSILQNTTYSRYRVLLVCATGEGSSLDLLGTPPLDKTRRFGVLHTTSSLGGSTPGNLAAVHEDSEILIFLDDRAVVNDPHWIEKFVLLFERHRHLLLASPRICNRIDEQPTEPRETFDVEWDWASAGFSRQRAETPLDENPYQAWSVPPECFAVHRERFLELGGLDRTVLEGPPPVLDLSIHGWLSGYEVLCHPGITVEIHDDSSDPVALNSDSVASTWDHYAQVLPAVKYFTNSMRSERCKQKSAEAAAMLEQNSHFLERRRRHFLDYSRFDDDWLFYKFKVED